MFYALAGIPLGLVMFQSIGERLNTYVEKGLRQFKKCFKFKNVEVNLCVKRVPITSLVVGQFAKSTLVFNLFFSPRLPKQT